MVDIDSIVSMLIAQAPLVAVTILAIILYMERRFSSVEERLSSVERGLRAIVEFNGTMLYIQVSRGVVSDTEYRALASLLSLARIVPSSKYYTKEIYERLGELLKKDPNEITWEDVFELEKIYDILMKEAEESKRPELAGYAAKLRVLIVIAQGLLLKRGVLPPEGRLR